MVCFSWFSGFLVGVIFIRFVFCIGCIDCCFTVTKLSRSLVVCVACDFLCGCGGFLCLELVFLCVDRWLIGYRGAVWCWFFIC